jgi:hypothetical protein
MNYPRELLRHQLVAVSASVLLVAVGVFAFVFGYRAADDFANASMAFGALFVLIGIPLAYLATNWYRRAAYLVAAGRNTPASMRLVAERALNSTTLYAKL